MVVPVAKDIDALFALTFGHVQGALVTPSSLDVLKKVNPNAAASKRRSTRATRFFVLTGRSQ